MKTRYGKLMTDRSGIRIESPNVGMFMSELGKGMKKDKACSHRQIFSMAHHSGLLRAELVKKYQWGISSGTWSRIVAQNTGTYPSTSASVSGTQSAATYSPSSSSPVVIQERNTTTTKKQ
jgi:hypothetical protein